MKDSVKNLFAAGFKFICWLWLLRVPLFVSAVLALLPVS